MNFGTKTLHLELGCVFLIFYVHPYILEEDSQPEPILTFADFFEKGLKLNHQPLAIYKRELNPTLKGNNTSPRERSDPNHRLGKIRTVWSGRFRSTGTKSSEAMGWPTSLKRLLVFLRFVTRIANICLNIFFHRVKVDGMYYVYMCHVYLFGNS